MLTPEETKVKVMGDRLYSSPLNLSTVYGDGIGNFIPEDAKVRFQVELYNEQDGH
ncbi:MAG: hypothetical protein GY863_19015, partial [bacterium]|nr:hypothetical protein [bacterium]